jgi:hypothetical protein
MQPFPILSERKRLPTMLFSHTCPMSRVFFEQTSKSMAHNNCMLSVTPFTLPSPTLVADWVQENQMAGDLQFPTEKCSFKFLNK